MISKYYIGFFFLALSLASCFQLLNKNHLPHSPNEDLSRHVAHAINFKNALFSGQLIPRLQVIDQYKSNVVNDIPVFQYYGFLTSLCAQPFLFAKILPLTSVVLGIVFLRFVGCTAIYLACKNLGFSVYPSLIAPIAWLTVPYISTNLYERVAFPEASAQCVIPLIPLAFSLLEDRKPYKAFTITTISIFFLALSHPVFLLWGCVAYFILTILFITRMSPKLILIEAVGVINGLALSSFQWLPAFLSSKELTIKFFAGSPFSASYLSSNSGFYGFPVPLLLEHPGGHVSNYYFTISAWIAPSLICAVYLRTKSCKHINLVYCFSLITLIFTILVFAKIDIWQYLPKLFWATQFPYRLISFIAVFAVFPLAYVLEKTSKNIKPYIYLLFFVSCLTNYPSYISSLNESGAIPAIEGIEQIYASQDYLITKAGIAYGDGWLKEDNLLSIPEGKRNLYINLCSRLPSNEDNTVYIKDAVTDIVFQEFVISSNLQIQHIIIPDNINKIKISSDKTFIPSQVSASNDQRKLGTFVGEVGFSRVEAKFITKDMVLRKVTGPYSRFFSPNANLEENKVYLATLPLAYSPFYLIQYGNQILSPTSTSDGNTQVEFVAAGNNIINASYKMPNMVWGLVIIGCLISLSICCEYLRKRNSQIL